ncbi:hypothetical protein EVAR_85251_1 [Eumeta japonica]|uniref:Uncharacterized protein n=1 Tax=Eumeta variegata TaxID=151549 RepID=A0A4C1W1V4_EUMVA|nr:hypothetical protein EVAR_85251_1 [Eumeta japonica]
METRMESVLRSGTDRDSDRRQHLAEAVIGRRGKIRSMSTWAEPRGGVEHASPVCSVFDRWPHIRLILNSVLFDTLIIRSRSEGMFHRADSALTNVVNDVTTTGLTRQRDNAMIMEVTGQPDNQLMVKLTEQSGDNETYGITGQKDDNEICGTTR